MDFDACLFSSRPSTSGPSGKEGREEEGREGEASEGVARAGGVEERGAMWEEEGREEEEKVGGLAGLVGMGVGAEVGKGEREGIEETGD